MQDGSQGTQRVPSDGGMPFWWLNSSVTSCKHPEAMYRILWRASRLPF